MKVFEEIVKIASEEVGYAETPPNTNKTKYGKWFGLDGMPWCGIFVSWCYTMAGFNLGKIGFLKGFAGCQTAVAFFKETNRIIENPHVGCLVFFDWNLDGRYDHVGIFKEVINEYYFLTIEGNTSKTNQSNGGTVMLRKRKFGKGVLFASPEKKN